MPCLLPRAITPSQLSRLARCLPKRCALQVRQRHNGDTTTISSLHKTQPTVNEDGQLMRSRKHGFRSLPLSPLMRERKPSKKVSRDAADDEAMAELHKEVAMNPFAHALATPIRQCNLTFARLPSHYLLPFATIIEKSPPANKGQPPRVKAHLQPGLRSEHSGVTLGQNSHVVNRQDMVRHLSRKRHWTPLATERHKATVAQMAHRSPSASKLIEQCWVWEDKVLAAAELLEGRAVKALKEAFDVVKTDGSLPTAREERSAFALVFSDASQGENADGSSGLDSDITTYDLSALLPAETLEKLQADNNLPSSPIFIPKSASTVHAQLALDKLKAHKEANEDTKPPPRRSSPSNLAALGEGQSSEESPGSGPRPRGGVDSLMG